MDSRHETDTVHRTRLPVVTFVQSDVVSWVTETKCCETAAPKCHSDHVLLFIDVYEINQETRATKQELLIRLQPSTHYPTATAA